MDMDSHGFFNISKARQAISVAAEKAAKEIERFKHPKNGRTDGHRACLCQLSLRHFRLLDPYHRTQWSQGSYL